MGCCSTKDSKNPKTLKAANTPPAPVIQTASNVENADINNPRSLRKLNTNINAGFD
jgi:hypothetical protein